MSRIIDERGRMPGKVNVVDILVFLVIVAVVFAITRLTGSSSQKVPGERAVQGRAARRLWTPSHGGGRGTSDG